jgi:hypothetical protein
MVRDEGWLGYRRKWLDLYGTLRHDASTSHDSSIGGEARRGPPGRPISAHGTLRHERSTGRDPSTTPSASLYPLNRKI